ncbi:MAG: p-hydroxybenzoate 3-monooxygenase [Solirubrobacteraceae bacterium]|jgi:p-hydroxybenzoate 3-monooxygenase|nr:p-hydroxybenzoate 3-monooxygenase [Solirubrobacteraceae bacterium]
MSAATTRTQVAIVGAGPAGLLLSHLLHRQGIESVVLEARSRDHVERRVRAGVLEQGTVDLLRETGVGARLEREGLVHEGLELRFDGEGHRIDFGELTGGRTITVYGQQEVVKDLIAARLQDGGDVRFEVDDVTLHDLDSHRPRVSFRHEGAEHELRCDVVAGCDGFHGVCREAIPAGALEVFERLYPFAWLGILAEVAPSSHELVYCHHERGFALHSMRSPRLTRLYLQCRPDDDLGAWPDERIWDELQTRLATADGWTLTAGPIVEKGITPMRSFVVEPLRHGRLFLAGDAAHIVPPTGAKGLNLAVNDVRVLSDALAAWYRGDGAEPLDAYSDACLRRVWRVQHFSWWMTSMLHRFAGDDPFETRLQRSQLRYVTSSRAAATTLAENYVGLAHV